MLIRYWASATDSQFPGYNKIFLKTYTTYTLKKLKKTCRILCVYQISGGHIERISAGDLRQ